MEENDDGTFSKWFKENFFDKSFSQKDVADFFSLSETDIENFDTTKKKKKKKDANSNNK